MTTKEKLEKIFGEIKESEWVEYAKVNRLIDELAKERDEHKKEIDRILSAVSRGENLAETLNFDGKSELQKERERSAKLVELLKEYEQWEADLIADNAMWWPSVPKDRISGKTYDTMLILQNKRNELLNQKNS